MMIKHSNSFIKVVFLICLTFIAFENCVFAEDVYWHGKTRWRNSPGNFVTPEGRMSDSHASGHSFHGMGYTYTNWSAQNGIPEPRAHAPGVNDTGIFSDESAHFTPFLESNTLTPGGFLFKSKQAFAFRISGSTLSFEKTGVTNHIDQTHTFKLQNESNLNFKNNAKAAECSNGGKIVYKVENSNVTFFGSSSGENAEINLEGKSTLTINQNNSIGHLKGDSDSLVNLGNFELKIGSNNGDQVFSGLLGGKEGAKLIKEGAGKLQLQGNYRDFLGTIQANSGELEFSNYTPSNIISNNSNLTFNPGMVTDQTKVSLNNAKFFISGDNGLKSLDSDANSDISLEGFSLTLGHSNSDNQLMQGALHGHDSSKVVKVGTGVLNLKADYSDFKGKIEVKEGTLALINEGSGEIITKQDQISFRNNSTASPASIQLLGGQVAVRHSNVVDEGVTITDSTLKIKQALSIGALSTDKTIHLDESTLEIGRNNKKDVLSGGIIGNSKSTIIKQGKETLELTGDLKKFAGNLIVNEGALVLKTNLSSKITSNNAKIEFKSNAYGDGSNLNLKSSKLYIDQSNSLETLNADATSEIHLGKHELKLSNNSNIAGALLGETSSGVCFNGEGTLTLDGDHSSYNGTVAVERGSLELKNASPANIKANGKATIRFKEGGKAKLADIHLSDSTIEFLEKSSGDSASLSLAHKSTLKISQHTTLGSLKADSSSNVRLGHFELEVGKNDKDHTFEGNLHGTSSSKYTKVGNGTLDLTGDFSDFHGELVVKEGTLELKSKAPKKIAANGGVLKFKKDVSGNSSRVTLSNNSELYIDHNQTLGSLNTDPTGHIFLRNYSLTVGSGGSNDIIEGTLHGNDSSQFVKEGDGKLELRGDITPFQGSFCVDQGALSLKNAGSSKIFANGSKVLFEDDCHAEAASINISNEGLLQFMDSGAGDKAAVILSKNSSLQIAQKNSLGSLNTDETSHVILNDFALEIGSNHGRDTIYGDIQGNTSAELIKVGNGTLDLKGNNKPFVGKVLLNEGVLLVNGHLGGDLIVNNRATLGGSGYANNIIVSKGGTIAPGNSIGTLSLTGNYVQQEESEYLVQVDDKMQSSLIDVKGSATFEEGYQIKVKAVDGYEICRPYKIFHAEEGISGEFSGASLDHSFKNSLLKAKIKKDHNDLFLTIRTNFAEKAETENQRNVAKQIDDGMDDPSKEEKDLINQLLKIPKDKIGNALDSMSGEQYTNFIIADQRATQRFLRRLFLPIRTITVNEDCPELYCNEIKVWSDFGAGRTFQKGEDKAKGYKTSNFNMTFGAHRSINDWLTGCSWLQFIPGRCLTGWTVGLAASYEHESMDFNVGGESSRHNTQGAIYVLVTGEWYYAFTNLVLGSNTGKFERRIKSDPINHRTHSKPNLFQATASYEFGLNNICMSNIAIQPFGCVETGYYSLSEVKENGAHALNLRIKDTNFNLTNTRLGFHFTKIPDLESSWEFALDVAWNHLFNFENHLRKRFEFAKEYVDVEGPKPSLNGLEAAFTVYKAVNNWIDVYAELSGEKWTNYSYIDISGGVSIRW